MTEQRKITIEEIIKLHFPILVTFPICHKEAVFETSVGAFKIVFVSSVGKL